MRKWIQKFIDQFDTNPPPPRPQPVPDEKSEMADKINEDRATLLYIIDTYNKNLFEVGNHRIRKVRETFDEFAKQLLDPENPNTEKLLFRFRQYFSSYRIDEYSYVQKTFDEFRGIIWDFVDQLSDDFNHEQVEDAEILSSLNNLKEAVESNSIEDLRSQSRLFIDNYTEFQTKKDERKKLRLENVKSSLDSVKKKLVKANQSMRVDHLTGAFNRKSFDEQLNKHWRVFQLTKSPISMLVFDIDFFKKINDNYGHDVGDFILIESVKLIKENLAGEDQFLARIGGEEFALILPDHAISQAIEKAESILNAFRKEVFIHGDSKIKLTFSMGISQLQPGEEVQNWFKRADEALYVSKNSGRDQFTISDPKRFKIA